MKGFRGWGLGVSKIAIALFIFLYPIPYTLYPVYAEDIGFSRIHPASPFYFLKTIRENLELKFAATYHVKLLRQLEFATRRLREIRTIILINEDLIPPTIERYIAHLNSFTDKHQDKEQLSLVQNNLANHLNALQQIYDKVSTPRSKMFIRSAMNRVIQRSDVANDAKVLICDLFTKEASSSVLNQTEQVVVLDRADKCHRALLR